MLTLSHLRDPLAVFAVEMETQLRANDHKPGWKNDDPWTLLARLHQEAEELGAAMEEGASPEEIAREAADIANFAMMIADVYGGLERDSMVVLQMRYGISNEALAKLQGLTEWIIDLPQEKAEEVKRIFEERPPQPGKIRIWKDEAREFEPFDHGDDGTRGSETP